MQPDDFKPMPTIGKGVEEIWIRDDSDIYRVITPPGLPMQYSCCTRFRRRRSARRNATSRLRKLDSAILAQRFERILLRARSLHATLAPSGESLLP